jgi:tetraacyldisaccharide-1-P 4'-kinase
MNKTQTKKLAAIVAKSANQEDAVLSYFAAGNTLTRDGAQNAGIGDPKRVVNRLRSTGVKVLRAKVVTRHSSDITYTLADKQPKKVQKQIASLA